MPNTLTPIQYRVFLLIKTIFAGLLIFLTIPLIAYHYTLINFPYPNTYREGALMATTSLLSHGINPYHFFLEPQHTNIYGILYPLIVLPFTHLTGITLVTHRWVTGFFIAASCLFIGIVLHQKKTPVPLTCWAMIALYASLIFPLTTTPCVDPASTGLFFMLLTIFWPFLRNYSTPSIVLSLIFSILAFYTKPYFFIGFPILISYLFLFISKKKALVFSILGLILFITSLLVINHFLPSYIDDCFFVHNNYAHRYNMDFLLERQVRAFSAVNKGMLGALFLACGIKIIYSLFFKKFITFKNILHSFSFNNFSMPLIKFQFPLEAYAAICSALVLGLSLGKHDGTNLWYFFQLFSPFLIIMTASICGQYLWWPLIFSSLLIFNLLSLGHDDKTTYFNINLEGWSTVKSLISSHITMFHSPALAPLLIEKNKAIYDDGQSEYFYWGAQRQGFFSLFFKEDQRVNNAQKTYSDTLHYMLYLKQFDLILIEGGYTSSIIPNLNTSPYQYIGSIWVSLPQDRRPLLITIWRPT